MKTSIIYHSYSGITRGVAEQIQKACGGDLIEVKLKKNYSSLTAYSLGCYRARKEECDPIEPETIDVSHIGSYCHRHTRLGIQSNTGNQRGDCSTERM